MPFIQEEIRRRWREMPLGTMIPFVWSKERYSWRHDKPPLDGETFAFKALAHSIAVSFPALWLVFGTVFSLSLLRKWQNRQSLAQEYPLLLLPIITAVIFAILALAESSPRYGYMFNVFWALLAAAGLATYLLPSTQGTLTEKPEST